MSRHHCAALTVVPLLVFSPFLPVSSTFQDQASAFKPKHHLGNYQCEPVLPTSQGCTNTTTQYKVAISLAALSMLRLPRQTIRDQETVYHCWLCTS